MRRPLRVSMIVVALAAAGSLASCTPSGTDAATSGTSSTGQPAKVKSTIYFVADGDGKKTYLTAEDPLVAAVTDVVTSQAEATDDRDAGGIDFAREFAHYSPDLAAQARSDEDSVLAFYRTNDLTTRHVGIYWFEMSFDASRKKSTVHMVDQFVYAKASDAYYAKAKLLPTTVVAQERTYSLELVRGAWTITAVQASGETAQPGQAPTAASR